jgi:hypothetical protein
LKTWAGLCCYALLIGFLSGTVKGAQLFDGGTPDGSSGLRVADFGRLAIAADDFRTSTAWQIESVEFWADEFPGQFVWDGKVQYFIFAAGTNGRPTGQPIFSGFGASVARSASGNPSGRSQYRYTFSFPVPLQLAASTTYWLALNLGVGTGIQDTQAFWASTGNASQNTAEISGSALVVPPSFSGWSEYGFNLAFRLYGQPVPPSPANVSEIPATSLPVLLTIFLGVASIGAYRLSRRRN